MEKHDSRTGRIITRGEGEVYQVYDGPDFVGYFKVVDGQEVPATKSEYDERQRTHYPDGLSIRRLA